MTWLYNDRPLTEEDMEGYVGFVYHITNTKTDKKYIGKKLFRFSRKKSVKGQKRKRRFIIESDWSTYYGSNKELLKDVELLGEEHFHREILKLCRTKGEMSYWETYYQFQNNVLFREDYYNQFISCRINESHLKNISENSWIILKQYIYNNEHELRVRFHQILKGENPDGLDELRP